MLKLCKVCVSEIQPTEEKNAKIERVGVLFPAIEAVLPSRFNSISTESEVPVVPREFNGVTTAKIYTRSIRRELTF